MIYPEVGACSCKSACTVEVWRAIDANHHEASKRKHEIDHVPYRGFNLHIVAVLLITASVHKPKGQRSAKSGLMSEWVR